MFEFSLVRLQKRTFPLINLCQCQFEQIPYPKSMGFPSLVPRCCPQRCMVCPCHRCRMESRRPWLSIFEHQKCCEELTPLGVISRFSRNFRKEIPRLGLSRFYPKMPAASCKCSFHLPGSLARNHGDNNGDHPISCGWTIQWFGSNRSDSGFEYWDHIHWPAQNRYSSATSAPVLKWSHSPWPASYGTEGNGYSHRFWSWESLKTTEQ